MSNVVQEFFNNRTPENTELYNAFKRGEVDIFGNRQDSPNYSLAISSQNPNLGDTSVLSNAFTSVGSSSDPMPLTSMFELNNMYQEILGRPFTDGDEILQVYSMMTPESVREELINSPEAQIYRKGGSDLSLNDRTRALSEFGGGLSNIQDTTNDGVKDINDLLTYISDTGYDPTQFGNAELINMQITPGLNTVQTNTPQGFYGVNPSSGLAELMTTAPENLMFRSGARGFTDNLPSNLEFGIPAAFANVPVFQRQTMADFEAAEKAKIAEANKNRKKSQGMDANFNLSSKSPFANY